MAKETSLAERGAMPGPAFTPLRSQRLLIRPICPADVRTFAAYRGLPEVARFQSWTTFDEVDAVRLVEAQQRTAFDTPGTWFQLVIVEASSEAIIGDCAIHVRPDDPRQTEIGITLAPAHQGRGLAREALTRLLAYLFEDLGKHRVLAITDADNAVAMALFLGLGFRQEARFVEHVWYKGAYGSECLFALLRREWMGRPSV